MSRRAPVTTVVVLLVTAVTTATQFVVPGIVPALSRRPGMIGADEWWRLVTPILINPEGWRQILFNFTAIAVVGVGVERLFGARRWLLFYGTGAIVGEIAGAFWQPAGAGSSVAGAGLLGALAVWLVQSPPLQGRVGGGLILVGAIVLCAMRDIHGPPILAGACLAALAHSTRSTSAGSMR